MKKDTREQDKGKALKKAPAPPARFCNRCGVLMDVVVEAGSIEYNREDGYPDVELKATYSCPLDHKHEKQHLYYGTDYTGIAGQTPAKRASGWVNDLHPSYW